MLPGGTEEAVVYTARCNSSAKKVVIIDNLSLPSHPAVNPELAAGSFYGAKEEMFMFYR